MENEPVRIPITDVFDLHSVPPRDVRAVIEEYLLEARKMGFKALRIIHGRGIGVQREAGVEPGQVILRAQQVTGQGNRRNDQAGLHRPHGQHLGKVKVDRVERPEQLRR